MNPPVERVNIPVVLKELVGRGWNCGGGVLVGALLDFDGDLLAITKITKPTIASKTRPSISAQVDLVAVVLLAPPTDEVTDCAGDDGP